jgi:hypothetical protein
MKNNKPLVRLLAVSCLFALITAFVIDFGSAQNRVAAACQKECIMPEIKRPIPVVNPLGILWTKFM